MRRSTWRALIACWLGGVCLLLPRLASAQIEDNISIYGGDNARGYMRPLRDALCVAFSNGLYTSAAIPDRFFVRLELQLSAVHFGSGDKTFRATTEPYYPNPSTVEVPTVVGSTESVTVTDSGSGASFSFPGGLDLGWIALGVPQLRIGGVKGSELIVRWLGFDTNEKDVGKVDLFGIGLRHNISQHLSELPFELAVMVNYMKLDLSSDLLKTRQWNFGVQGSKRFGPLEPYAGLALDRFAMDLSYTQEVPGSSDQRIDISYDNETEVHATAGASLHMGFAHLNAELNVQKLTSFSVGLALGN